MDKFIIASTGVSLNYMPHYIAKERGLFQEVGLEVTTIVPSPWTDALKAIDEGVAHVVEGGIWVPIIYHNRVREYKSFAKLSSRCPLVLVGRKPVETFQWEMLENKKILIAGGDGASHGLFILGAAKEAGVDMSKVKVVQNFMGPMLLELFLGGLGDIIALQPDVAAQLAQNNQAYIIANLTEVGGTCPWSVYYGTERFMKDKNQLAERFSLAIQKATSQLIHTDASEYVDIYQKYWHKMDNQFAVDTVNLFRKEGMWSPSIQVDKEIISRWQQFLMDGHLIDQPIPHEKIIDDGPYLYAKKQLEGRDFHV